MRSYSIKNFWLKRLLVFFIILLPVSGITEETASISNVSMIVPYSKTSSYWPRWRGPSGQGLVTDSKYTDTWSDSKNVHWKTQVTGDGNSSPIIWGDYIFLTTAYDKGQRRSVLAFQRSDGGLLWECFLPDATPERAHIKNGHASATPTTDGRYIYIYFGSHGLAAVDMKGKLAWHTDLGTINTVHGTACSPLLYRDLVIIVQDLYDGKGSFIGAFDKDTGKERWRTARDGKRGWYSPIAIRVGERDEIVVSGSNQVQAYDPETGKNLWLVRGNNFEVIPTPAVGFGLLFCSSGREGPTLAIKPGGSGDVTDTHIVWSIPKDSPFVPSPIVYGDYLYMINDITALASCIEARSGKILWQEKLGDARREGFSSSPIAVDGKVFFTNDNGETFVLKAGPEFNLLHVNRLGESILASPACLDGVWYWRTTDHLIAIGDTETQ
ncbi:PQQ-binding-like beta-propeller repeat protein [Candidatus Latescibacterota bacterium]